MATRSLNLLGAAARPVLRPVPLALLVTSAVLYAAADYFLQGRTLSLLLGELAAYGLCGLYLSPPRWRRGLPFALILFLLLLLDSHAGSYLGLWARLFTAQVVHGLLQAQHVAALSTQTILVLENGIAHIDVPCSGLRSLGAGGLLYLGATWVQDRRIDARWLRWGTLLLLLLLLANLVRVYTIVVLGLVLGMPRLAEVLHEPLGILGFVLASAVTYLGLGRPRRATAKPPTAEPSPRAPEPERAITPRWLPPLLLGILAILAALHALHAPRRPPAHPPVLTLSPLLSPQPVELTDGERGLFARFGAGAQKWRFRYGAVSGSLITVATTAWRAQHPPELCFSGAGYLPRGMQTVAIDPDFSVRRLQLWHPEYGSHLAAYWFQSRGSTTADRVTRILDSLPILGRGQQRWVMVSILFEGPLGPGPQDAMEQAALYRLIHRSVATFLEGNSS